MSDRTTGRSQQSAEREATQSVTIRLSARVLSHFKESGPGYQTRIREALERHIERERRLESFDRVCTKLRRLSLRDKAALAALQQRPLNTEPIHDPFNALSD